MFIFTLHSLPKLSREEKRILLVTLLILVNFSFLVSGYIWIKGREIVSFNFNHSNPSPSSPFSLANKISTQSVSLTTTQPLLLPRPTYTYAAQHNLAVEEPLVFQVVEKKANYVKLAAGKREVVIVADPSVHIFFGQPPNRRAAGFGDLRLNQSVIIKAIPPGKEVWLYIIR